MRSPGYKHTKVDHTHTSSPSEGVLDPISGAYVCSDCKRMRAIPRVTTMTGQSYCIECVVAVLSPLIKEQDHA